MHGITAVHPRSLQRHFQGREADHYHCKSSIMVKRHNHPSEASIVNLNDLHLNTKSQDFAMLARANSTFAVHSPRCRKSHLAPISPNNPLESILEPLDRLWLIDAVAGTDLALAASSLGYPLAWSCPVAHTVSTGPPKTAVTQFPTLSRTYMQQ